MPSERAVAEMLLSLSRSTRWMCSHSSRFTDGGCAAMDFQATGGFDSAYMRAAAEDRDLCDRLRACGFRMTYAADAVVYHAHALTFGTFWRQHFNYGRGANRFHTARARRSRKGVRVEPFSFYLELLRYPFKRRTGRQAPLLAALLLISQAANALGFLWEDTTARLE